MNLNISRKIGIGFVVALVALILVGLVCLRNLSLLNADAKMVTHTMEVLQRLEGLDADLLEAQGSAREYEYMGGESYETEFSSAASRMTSGHEALRSLTADNPIQQDRLIKLAPLILERIRISQALMAIRRGGGNMNDAAALAGVQKGQKLTEEIRKTISDMEDEERRLLSIRQKKAEITDAQTRTTITYGTFAGFVLVGLLGFLITKSITSPIRELKESATVIGGGNYAERIKVKSKDEVGDLGNVFNAMVSQIQERQRVISEQDWLQTSLGRFASQFQGQRDIGIFCQNILNDLAALLDAKHLVLYVADFSHEPVELRLRASYGATDPKPLLKAGEGLVGQCFLEKKRIQLTDVPNDYIKINSGLGAGKPANIVVQPAVFEDRARIIIELASFVPFTEIQLTLLGQLADSIGIVFTALEANVRTEELLARSEKLSVELGEKNVVLQAHSDRLRKSEQQLQEQQEELKQANEEMEQTNEELQQANEEMEEKTNLLTEQKKEVERANHEIETARVALEEKARQLSLISKYKSEFLANMSHELRTPLNSLLILSKMLADNTGNNLSEKQVQYAQTIHSSGNDLLELINDILDLAKIESGNVDIELSDLAFTDFADFVRNTFGHVAETKKLDFQIRLDPRLPKTITTDVRRLEQVLKNLLSNAFKFTSKGTVALEINVSDKSGADTIAVGGSPTIAFSVTDTGIGIPEEKQELIFEAFQQADAGTARKYGGTGLGLSISREIARLLGGSLSVKSKPGEGSTFTLYLPAVLKESDISHLKLESNVVVPKVRVSVSDAEEIPAAGEIEADPDGTEDDRANLKQNDLVLLIIEDDKSFARILMEFAREKNFKAVIAGNAAKGIALAQQLKPAAITLDIRLPDNDGWVVFDRLKHDPQTRHIPIHVISVDDERERGLRLGAVAYLQKPVSKESIENAFASTLDFINKPFRNLLIVEDDPVQRQNLVDLIGNGDVHTTAVGNSADALTALDRLRFDCVVVDLILPDMGGADLIREIHKRFGHRAPPIIVYTGKDLTREEETNLRKIAESIVIKDVRSPERLLDETALFLHRVQSKLPESKQRMIEQVQKSDAILAGRKVLIVDDDVRNIFAITSALEAYKMEVLYAENGQAGIDILMKNPDTDAVLMDVMMPEMDGFEATRRIRQMDKFKKIPIISVTAKAMKGDREKCLQAGASDYITKPVDMDQLRSLLRVWLYR